MQKIAFVCTINENTNVLQYKTKDFLITVNTDSLIFLL